MAVTSKASGSQTATISTEHTLTTQTDAGVYVLVVDCNAMANGDELELRIKTKDKAGGASRLAYIATYAHVQAEPHKYSVPVPIDTEIVCTLKQIAGTGRTFDWNLLSL
jgi:hypothetical protein